MAKIPSGTHIWYIYKIVNPTGRVYIGVTGNINRRKRDYRLGHCKNQKALYASFTKHTFESHSFSVIDTFSSDYDYALGKEMSWIRSLMSDASKYPEQGGLNMSAGGRGSIGRVVSEETKQKLRNANIGKKYSEEVKKKLSDIRRQNPVRRKFTEEQRRQASEIRKGMRHTDEAKRKISEAGKGNKNMLGKKQSQETIDKRRQKLMGNKFNVGRRQSEESKLKKSLSLKGRVFSEETRRLMSKIASEKRGRPILVYNKDGLLIKEFPTTAAASRELGFKREAIKDALRIRKNNRYKDFTFKYK